LTGKGISHPVTAVLIGLAVVQGLVVAVALAAFLRKNGAPGKSGAEAARAATPAQTTGAQVTEPQAAQRAPDTQPPPAAANEGTDPELASAKQPVPGPASSVPPAKTQTRTQSCDELFAKAGTRDKPPFPGAAFEQLKVARKALVKGDVDEAQRAYCTAVRWDAQNPNHYFELAQLLLLRNDGAAAAHWAKEGVRLEPSSPRGQSLLGDALAHLADAPGARAAWFAAARIPEPSASQIADLTKRSLLEAEQALIRRDLARAERFFRRAVILDPASAAANLGLATALLRLGEPEPAERAAGRAFELSPRDPRVRVTLGDIAAARSDSARAKQHYAAAAELGHPDAAQRLKRLP
jgi:Flp pilus assembly protein TadD